MSDLEVREGYKKTKVGIIPEDWEVRKLDNIAKRFSGHTPNKKKQDYWNGDIPWISLKDTKKLDNRYINETTDYTTKIGIKNSSAILLPENTVVISRDATIGKVGITRRSMATSQHFINYVCSNKLSNFYLYYYLFYNKPKLVSIAVGSTIKTIGLNFFKSFNIPIPPIKEQQKIASILSSVDEHSDEVDGMIEDLKKLKKGLMQKLLTGKYTLENGKLVKTREFKKTRLGMIPKHWEVKDLEECFKFENGKAFYTEGYSTKGKKVIDLMNISSYGTFQELDNKQKYISEKIYNKYNKFQLSTENLIMAMSDMSAKLWILGKTAIIPKNNTYILNQRIGKLTPYAFMNLKYSNYATNSNYFLKQLKREAKGTAQYYVNTSDIKKSRIYIPPLKEQQKIASILSTIDTRIEIYKEEKESIKQLKKGLMQQLLTGKKRVKVNN